MGVEGLRFRRNTLEDTGAGVRKGRAPTAGRGRTHLGIRILRLLPTLGPGRLQPRRSHGLAARLFPPLVLHARCHVRRELLEPDTRSLSLGQTRKPRLSPLKNYRVRVPAAAATQTRADTSHFRERVASARRAGAVSGRARNASASADGVGGRRGGRRARENTGWDVAARRARECPVVVPPESRLVARRCRQDTRSRQRIS